MPISGIVPLLKCTKKARVIKTSFPKTYWRKHQHPHRYRWATLNGKEMIDIEMLVAFGQAFQ